MSAVVYSAKSAIVRFAACRGRHPVVPAFHRSAIDLNAPACRGKRPIIVTTRARHPSLPDSVPLGILLAAEASVALLPAALLAMPPDHSAARPVSSDSYHEDMNALDADRPLLPGH
jgi:hypothetical protein